MSIKLPPAPGRQTKGRPPCTFRQQRAEAERRRRDEFARLNVASALKLKGAF